MEISPLYLCIPACLACTYAFMLPVATPPNAVVFSFGYVKTADMVRICIDTNSQLTVYSINPQEE